MSCYSWPLGACLPVDCSPTDFYPACLLRNDPEQGDCYRDEIPHLANQVYHDLLNDFDHDVLVCDDCHACPLVDHDYPGLRPRQTDPSRFLQRQA
ncbi:MAG: hypothetical protein VX910_00200 [Candidatus Latescibacterota bacterium]|nr:hypothetical protein [Candidatus Latescibacterota bacterium]